MNFKHRLSDVNYISIFVTLAEESCHLYVFVRQLVIIVEYRLWRWCGLVGDIFLQWLVLHHVITSGCCCSSLTC